MTAGIAACYGIPHGYHEAGEVPALRLLLGSKPQPAADPLCQPALPDPVLARPKEEGTEIMTKEDWLFRLEVVEYDLAAAESSKAVPGKTADCDTLRRYVQWIKMKTLKASSSVQVRGQS